MNESQDQQYFDVFAARCPSRAVFEHIFSQWGVLLLAKLSDGPARFGELRRSIEGISERMLSRRLKTLEEEGLIYRRDYRERPARVEYGLTESGKRISRSVLGLLQQLYHELGNRETPDNIASH